MFTAKEIYTRESSEGDDDDDKPVESLFHSIALQRKETHATSIAYNFRKAGSWNPVLFAECAVLRNTHSIIMDNNPGLSFSQLFFHYSQYYTSRWAN